MNTYLIYLAVAVSLFCGGFVTGCQHEQTKQEQVVREKEHQHQDQADQIRKQKDAQIASINSQLVDAISQLRQRPSRAQTAANGQSGTGATLSAEDAEFLIREAARADQIRTGLQACYAQYDSLK